MTRRPSAYCTGFHGKAEGPRRRGTGPRGPRPPPEGPRRDIRTDWTKLYPPRCVLSVVLAAFGPTGGRLLSAPIVLSAPLRPIRPAMQPVRLFDRCVQRTYILSSRVEYACGR